MQRTRRGEGWGPREAMENGREDEAGLRVSQMGKSLQKGTLWVTGPQTREGTESGQAVDRPRGRDVPEPGKEEVELGGQTATHLGHHGQLTGESGASCRWMVSLTGPGVPA